MQTVVSENEQKRIREISNYFFPGAEVTGIQLIQTGRINQTYILHYINHEKGIERAVLQKINHHVFGDPYLIDSNIAQIGTYIKDNGLVPYATPDKKTMIAKNNENGDIEYWRFYNYIQGYTKDHAENPEQFASIGSALGKFNANFEGFDASKLKEVIPDFHNTEMRYAKYQERIRIAEQASPKRLIHSREVIDWITKMAPYYAIIPNALNQGLIPLRVTHNDTKINNVMLDAKTHQAICMIDYDTIMPGYIGDDPADALRGMVNEEEEDLRKVKFDMNYCKAFMAEYAKETKDIMTPNEIALLPLSIVKMPTELCMRFDGEYNVQGHKLQNGEILGNYFGNADKGIRDLDLAIVQYLYAKSAYDCWQAPGGIEDVVFGEYSQYTKIKSEEYKRLAKRYKATK